MSKKRNQAMVYIIDGLTHAQAGKLKGVITTAKSRIAPNARGIGFSGDRSDIGKNLASSTTKLLTTKD